jgi:hypothetical protein
VLREDAIHDSKFVVVPRDAAAGTFAAAGGFIVKFFELRDSL